MVNKYLYIIVLVVLIGLSSCKQETKQLSAEETQNEETILTPLIKYTVLVEDTSFMYMMKKDSAFVKIYRSKDSSAFKSLVKNISYLPAVEFENYKSGLFNFLKNESSVVTDKNLSILKDEHSKKSIYVMCDSIMFIDEPKRPSEFVCDSTSTFMFIQGFDFYEKWSIENVTGNFKKEVLAYAPVKFNDAKKQFLPIFYVFKNKEIFEKIKTQIK